MSKFPFRRVLVTGANGFVGRHLGFALRQAFGEQLVICATSRTAAEDPVLGPITALDVTDAEAVGRLVQAFQPSHVLHLAGIASVQAANANPEVAWQVHLFGNLNIANAVLKYSPHSVLIAVGTGQVYGASARTGQALDESTLLMPGNTYEVTKAAGDLALGSLAADGLRCLRCRPFNHVGAGQSEDFVLPSFAMQIARIEAGEQPALLQVGNLDVERDFLDVRDVTNAYARIIARSDTIPSGTILNIASGKPRRVRELLDLLLARSEVAIAVVSDPTRMRPSDTPRFVGDATTAKRLLDWLPQYDIEETLASVLEDCRHRSRLNGLNV
jgi:GDP-4-dehydro-6-deoxy-D-mannose reductase